MPSKHIIVGRNPVLEGLKAGSPIEKIFLLVGTHGKATEQIRSLAEQRQISVIEADRGTFQSMAPGSVAQGVIALVPQRQLANLETIVEIGRARGERGFILLLDQIEDPHNLGALIRTAECTRVHGVVLPKHHAASVTPTVVKASAGAVEHMAIAEVTNLVQAIENLKKEGIWIIGLDPQGHKPYTDVDYTASVGIVIGNEGKGIRRLVKEHCDHLIRIPLLGKIGSLNASVAGALVMYEVVKQRNALERA